MNSDRRSMNYQACNVLLMEEVTATEEAKVKKEFRFLGEETLGLSKNKATGEGKCKQIMSY